MTDLEQHPAVESATNRILINPLFQRLRWSKDDVDTNELRKQFRRIIAAAVAKVRAEAFETAKDIYRGVHSGGCRRPSIGDECECFLCQIDDVAYPDNPQPESEEPSCKPAG